MNRTSVAQQAKTESFLPPAQGTLQRKCACGSHTKGGGECAKCAKIKNALQRKLTIGASNDPLEREADRVADQVMAIPTNSNIGRVPPRVQRFTGQPTGQAGTVPTSVDRVLASSGRPMKPVLRQDMEQRFGHDFSQVRVHSGAAAEQSARDVSAQAYTAGHNIVFGVGQFAPGTNEGLRLIAHELTHVVQQSYAGHPPAVQRQETFTGGPGKTALDKDRPLTAFAGPMPHTSKPGGTPIPKTAGRGQNCAGDSCSISKWINWPNLGLEMPKVTLPARYQGDWAKATNFVPTGCTRVNCSGVNVWSTRCKASELELIAFLYKWPVKLKIGGKPMTGTQSDFHMIGRNANSLPNGWHSKADRREKVADIRDPRQSLLDSYPHTKKKDRTIVKRCFCCNQSAIKTA